MASLQRLGMAKLKWLVVRDFQAIESATFWKDGPEIATGELVTERSAPRSSCSLRRPTRKRTARFTQTQRMLQWHHKAVEPPGDARSELHFFFHLGKIIKERLASSTLERDRPAGTWCGTTPRRPR